MTNLPKFAWWVLGLAFLAGCSGNQADSRSEITISAASSLAEPFTEIANEYRSENPGIEVHLNFGASSSLLAQIEAGAATDVFAAADQESLGRLARSGQTSAEPVVFALNSMQIAVKPGNPEGIESVSDLGRLQVVAMCSASVPCGKYGFEVLARAGVHLNNLTLGVDAKATLSAVSLGDAQAAIVYATDVLSAGTSVTGVSIARDQNVVVKYAIASLANSQHQQVVADLIEFVLSPSGQAILRSHGFINP